MDASEIGRVRSFHRLVGESIGALDDHFLGRDRPMGEARLLWEVGDGADVRDVRERLGLDPGYLSRLVRSLGRQGLIELTTDAGDRRVRRIVPTAAGRAERLELDRRSDALAESLLDPLDAHERGRLVAAMSEVERLMVRSRTTIELAAASSPQVRRCFDRYIAELQQRFDSGFDVTRSNRMDMVDLTPPYGLVLLARMGDDAVGCGALMFLPDDVAELKRVWIAPRVRGMGLGRKMLRALEERARDHGARVARLETNRSLVEAVAMYRADGYREVPAFNDEPYADHWFEKSLVEDRIAAPVRVRRLTTPDLTPADVAAIRGVMTQAFGDDEDEAFRDEDWDHALGGLHVVVDIGGQVVSHASVVERELHVDGRPLRTGYVEAVATAPDRQRQGLGTLMMEQIGAVITSGYELGALGTGSHHFYERLGWQTWQGPSFVRTADGVRGTPDEDGYILVLFTPTTPALDLTAAISCDWRPGDVW